MTKETKIQLIIVVVLSICLGILLFLALKDNKINQGFKENFKMEEEIEKETKKDDIDTGVNISKQNINLSDYESNINITESGEYNITGSFNYSIIINAPDTVTLNLNNVKINSTITGAIINTSSNDLIVNLEENTINTLSDNGSSEYDSCIYSVGKLTISGKGTLNVYGNQEEGEGIATENNDIIIDGDIYILADGDGIDSNKNLIINGGIIYTMGSSIGGDAGIDTDDGYVINGGYVIALGSDMLEVPLTSSKQNYLSFTLSEYINEGSRIILKDSDFEEVVSFTADENFKTLIVSNPSISKGTYYLYVNNEKTDYKCTVN